MGKHIKVLAVICFSLIIAALLTALISDGVILGRNILGFVVALIVSAATFAMGIILMIISCFLAFGIIIIQNNGFWPLAWAKSAFHEVLKDYPVTDSQINTLLIIRIILLAICVLVFITSIVLNKVIKSAKKKDTTIKTRPSKGFVVTSTIMSILGTVVSVGALVILLAIS